MTTEVKLLKDEKNIGGTYIKMFTCMYKTQFKYVNCIAIVIWTALWSLKMDLQVSYQWRKLNDPFLGKEQRKAEQGS